MDSLHQIVVENLPLIVMVFDHELRLKGLSGLLVQKCEIKPDTLVNELAQKVHRNLPFSLNHLRRALSGESFAAMVEFAKKKFEVTYQPIPTEQTVKYVVCLAQDVTARIEAEKNIVEQQAQLSNSSRLIALGEMAGGMAHEINNPITIILGNCRFLASVLSETPFDQPKALERLGKIEQTATRIAKIIRTLLNMARGGAQDKFSETNLMDIVQGAIEICRERFALAGISIRYEHLSEDKMTHCQVARISQVILNMLSNSFDAVQNMQSPWIHVTSKITESGTTIDFTDAGLGIPVEIREKIFAPFFTTKGVNKGTGIGLSLVKSIVEFHGGEISIDGDCPNTRFIIHWQHQTTKMDQAA